MEGKGRRAEFLGGPVAVILGAIGPNEPAMSTVKPDLETDIEKKEEHRLTPMYRVLIHNDDITPMDYVVLVLCEIFGKGGEAAMEIMFTAHQSGVALVTVLPLEEAEFRVERAHSKARTSKYPLTFSYEPE